MNFKLCFLGVCCFLAGAWVGNSLKAGQLAELRNTQANAAKAEAEANVKALKDAKGLGDTLTTELNAYMAANTELIKERDDALRQTTTGRPCLGAGTVRMLNSGSGSRDGLSHPTGQPAGADAAFATDTDVATWINDAQGQYDICRARLDKLIDFLGAP